MWIGINDIAVEGTFVWSDGSPNAYTRWNWGEPNNAGNNEDCTTLEGHGGWNDLNCSNHRQFACKYTDPAYGEKVAKEEENKAAHDAQSGNEGEQDGTEGAGNAGTEPCAPKCIDSYISDGQ